MDHEVPAYQLGFPFPAHGRDDDLCALYDYFFFSDEPLPLPRGDGGGGAGSSGGVHEPPLLTINPPDPPPPDLLPTHDVDTAGKETPSEAEMASWLGQVFEQKPRGAATATEGGDDALALPSSSGRKRSCSGKAAEQRRRTKIKDKLRTLQQMLPTATGSKAKTDQASMLEEVIKYVRSLQHQVQLLSANGYAIPTAPILPLGVMPPPWMQLPAGDVLGGQAPPPVMFPPYPVFPTVFAACPRQGTPMPLSAPYDHPVEPGSDGRQQLAPRRHVGPDDLTVPSRR